MVPGGSVHQTSVAAGHATGSDIDNISAYCSVTIGQQASVGSNADRNIPKLS